MRIDRIARDDIVEARIKGRVILGRVTEVNDGIVHFRPICPGAGWFHAKAREIVAHWRKTGRRGGGAEDEADTSAPVDGQLSLEGASE
jgi:hypothetical protein